MRVFYVVLFATAALFAGAIAQPGSAANSHVRRARSLPFYQNPYLIPYNDIYARDQTEQLDGYGPANPRFPEFPNLGNRVPRPSNGYNIEVDTNDINESFDPLAKKHQDDYDSTNYFRYNYNDKNDDDFQQNNWQYKPRHNRPKDDSQDDSNNDSGSDSHDSSRDSSQDSSQDSSRDSSEDSSQDSSQGSSQDSSQDSSRDSSEDSSQESFQDSSDESSQDSSQDSSHEQPQDSSQDDSQGKVDWRNRGQDADQEQDETDQFPFKQQIKRRGGYPDLLNRYTKGNSGSVDQRQERVNPNSGDNNNFDNWLNRKTIPSGESRGNADWPHKNPKQSVRCITVCNMAKFGGNNLPRIRHSCDCTDDIVPAIN